MDDGVAIEVIHGGDNAVLEFVFGCDADVAEHRAGELGEEAFDQIEPRAVLGGKGEFEAPGRLARELSLGLLGDVRGMIVEDQLDRRMGRIAVHDRRVCRLYLAAPDRAGSRRLQGSCHPSQRQ